ncbi:hypothetical protein [Pleionea sp. CnH1-48]|uniref:hypothetical protein n=1 Tax=Pleionea sp. CnH1-48 TaxID=2954494 RepID=UPI0020974430|nr:hypothetical protein [Pleionea sp. CnH1-48]MCO7225774.1 hypothetical protein [Pleionea sp. CnH1-48]
MAMDDVTKYAKVPAGTIFEFEDPATPDTFIKLPNIDSLGEVGQTGTFVEVTTLVDKTKKYVADRPDAPEKELVFIDNAGDADFKKFLDEAEKGSNVRCKITFPSGRIAETKSLTLAGWKMQDVSSGDNSAMKISVLARQNDITWSKSA